MTSIGFLGRKILCINNDYYNNIFLVCVLQQGTISCKNGPMKSLPPSINTGLWVRLHVSCNPTLHKCPGSFLALR